MLTHRGVDTIQLRFGENVTGGDLADNLKNIEKIDLSIDGENKIESLGVDDVLSMMDHHNVLEIFGIAGEDKVTLADGEWEVDNSKTQEGYTFYTAYDGSDVTLKVSNDIIVD